MTNVIRIKGKTLKLLKIKKDEYKKQYGRNNVRSYNDVIEIDLGIKMPYMSVYGRSKKKGGRKDKQKR